MAMLILGWLFVRQATPQAAAQAEGQPVATVQGEASDAADDNAADDNAADDNAADDNAADDNASAADASAKEPERLAKPRLLLAILTPVNLFTGVLSCGLICIMVIWMDRRELPAGLQPPRWMIVMNVVSAAVFIGLGIKGYWDNEHRTIVLCSMAGVFVVAMFVAAVIVPKLHSIQAPSQPTTGEDKS
jgi:hypothetical protein